MFDNSRVWSDQSWLWHLLICLEFSFHFAFVLWGVCVFLLAQCCIWVLFEIIIPSIFSDNSSSGFPVYSIGKYSDLGKPVFVNSCVCDEQWSKGFHTWDEEAQEKLLITSCDRLVDASTHFLSVQLHLPAADVTSGYAELLLILTSPTSLALKHLGWAHVQPIRVEVFRAQPQPMGAGSWYISTPPTCP